MTDEEKIEYDKLVEETKRLAWGEQYAAMEAQIQAAQTIKSDSFTVDIIGTIFLHPHQNKRHEQLRKINEARMSYGDAKYKDDFEKLDLKIDEICEDIFTLKKINEMSLKYGVKNLVFALWCKGTIHIEQIREAYELSSMSRMDKASQVLEDNINNPELQMQHSGLVRELALHHSRMAGFENQKKFGKRPDIEISSSPIQIVNDDQMDRIISAFREDESKKRALGAGNGDYISFEPIKKEEPILVPNKVEKEESIEDIINSSKKSGEDEESEEFDVNKY